jgi:hypothetical protein
MKLHFPNHKRSKLRAALTVVAVLALGVLAKLDATIQLCRSRSGASAAGKGHIIKEFN